MMNVQKSTASSILTMCVLVLLCLALYSLVKARELNHKYSEIVLRTSDLSTKIHSLEEEINDPTLNEPYICPPKDAGEIAKAINNNTAQKASIPLSSNENPSFLFVGVLAIFASIGFVLLVRRNPVILDEKNYSKTLQQKRHPIRE